MPVSRISARIPEEHAAALRKLVSEGRFPSLQAAVEAAVSKLLEAELGKDWKASSGDSGEAIDAARLMSGDSSMEEAVRKAVAEYIKSRMDPVV